jgi:SAM-dependent methyltransferase
MITPPARRALRRVEPLAKQVAQRVVPESVRFRVRLEGGRVVHVPRVGHVRWGGLRRLAPISRDNGYDRGTPIDRWFVEDFLRRHGDDIKGDVLDFYDDRNSRLFGSRRVRSVEVVHRTPGHPTATIAADLTDAPELASDSFDCVLLTQTLHVIYDMRAALATVQRVLRPGGVVLATFPGISQLSTDEDDDWADSWRFTGASAQRFFEEVFPPSEVRTEVVGNVLTATAFLQGVAAEELRPRELAHVDPLFELLVTVRARKPAFPG